MILASTGFLLRQTHTRVPPSKEEASATVWWARIPLAAMPSEGGPILAAVRTKRIKA